MVISCQQQVVIEEVLPNPAYNQIHNLLNLLNLCQIILLCLISSANFQAMASEGGPF